MPPSDARDFVADTAAADVNDRVNAGSKSGDVFANSTSIDRRATVADEATGNTLATPPDPNARWVGDGNANNGAADSAA